MRLVTMTTFFILAGTSVLSAQSNIDPTDKHAWGEDVGWTNWRDADGGNDGVVIDETFLSGFIWGENVGFINLGNGPPIDGVNYTNLDDTDFGVNIDENTGELFGMGWGENIGWVNFDGGALASPQQPARFDVVDCRFHGYVWAENVGWINLDDASHFVAAEELVCLAACAINLDCQDADPCVRAICDTGSNTCANHPRFYGDANHSGNKNVADVVCVARAAFQDATDCGGFPIDPQEIDYGPNDFPGCGNNSLNVVDVVQAALGIFNDFDDACCGVSSELSCAEVTGDAPHCP